MEKEEFTATEVIAGFPLVSIKRAIAHVGLMDDRDDIEIVADALCCPHRQAEGVLEALAQRGLVTKAKTKRQWDLTPLGNRLRFHWKPPRKIQPVIERDEESDAINESFESVWCSILRADSDDSQTFEEAQCEVGLWVDYESDRVIEISVVQPDFYDDPDSSSTIETSVYLAVREAKKFAQGLQTAIKRAETEIARRATAKPRRRGKERERVKAREVEDAEPESLTSTKSRNARAASVARKAAATERKAAATERKEQARKKREKSALASTLAELGQAR